MIDTKEIKRHFSNLGDVGEFAFNLANTLANKSTMTKPYDIYADFYKQAKRLADARDDESIWVPIVDDVSDEVYMHNYMTMTREEWDLELLFPTRIFARTDHMLTHQRCLDIIRNTRDGKLTYLDIY